MGLLSSAAADKFVDVFRRQPYDSVKHMQKISNIFERCLPSSTLQLLHMGSRLHYTVVQSDADDAGLPIIYDSAPLSREGHDEEDQKSARVRMHMLARIILFIIDFFVQRHPLGVPYYKTTIEGLLNRLYIDPDDIASGATFSFEDISHVTHVFQEGSLCLDNSVATLYDLMKGNEPGLYDQRKLRGWTVVVLLTGILIAPPKLEYI